MAENGELKIKWSIVIYFVSLITTALLTYSAIVARISVVETQQNALERRLTRIEDKLDRLLGK